MQLIAPPGYAAVAPFDKDKHAGLGVVHKGLHGFAAKLNAVYITTTEFVQAARHYPVVFNSDESKQTFAPMIVTSLTSGSNGFVEQGGDWDKNVYIPAYVRRYPFCVVEVQPEPDGAMQQLVCVDESALVNTDNSYFKKDGEPAEVWIKFQTFMQEYESARLATLAFTSRVNELGLFEVFEAQAFHTSGQRYHMTNMYRINEKKLKKLTAKIMREFMDKNYMYFIYAHLMSLDNFQQLLDRVPTSK